MRQKIFTLSEVVKELDLTTLEDFNISKTEDDFTIVQPLMNGEGIMWKMETQEDGTRKMNIEVSNTLIVMPLKEGCLDIFHSDEVAE